MSLASKLAEERRHRLAAERMLELKQAELYAANRKLGQHAQALQGQVHETRAEISTVRTENQRVKQELGVANHKVEVAERRLWHSIETITDGFAYFNADNEMIAANHAWLVAFDGLEVIKPGVNYVTILQMLTDEGIVNTGALAPADWRHMMLDRWMMPQPEATTLRLWNDQYIKLVDRRGPSGDVVSLGLDITETVEYEKQLKGARAQAEAANRAKSAFLANMSHEIRTPMNGVVGMADLLCETELNDEQELYVSTIRNSGEALLVIINDVLDYSKIEADKLVLHPEPFDLERCIHEVLLLLQPAAREKGLNLVLDYDLFLPTAYVGDPGRFRQVLTNLAGNAVKFTSEGHVMVRVTGIPEAEEGCGRVNISIEDTGIGIAQEKIQHIFGEFNQVENERNRQFDGTGLGLAISKRLVALMGGEIWVTSEEGVGSCFGFAVEMPFADEEPIAHPAIPGGLRRVLVVDDLEPNRRILEHQLMQLGLGVKTCTSAAEALELYKDGFDLILTDHNMPEMDGIELAGEIRAQGSEVPIILLSSNPVYAANDPGRGNVQAVLQKPLPRKELFRRLEDLGPILGEKTAERPVESEGWSGDEAIEDVVPVTETVSLETEDGPAKAVLEDAPAEAVLEDAPAEAVLEDAPAEAVLEDAPAEAVLEDAPAEAVLEDAPAEAVLEDAPAEAVLEDAPAEAVLEDAPSEAVLEDAPSEAVPEVEAKSAEDVPVIAASEEKAEVSKREEEADLPAPTFSSRHRSAPDTAVSKPPVETVSEAKPDAHALVEAPAVDVEPENAAPEPDVVPSEVPPEPDAPIAPAEPVAEEPVADPVDAPVENAPSEMRLMRILAAEDNKTNQLVFRKMVKDLNIDLTFANNGEEAVEAYKTLQPDLIFMDISMPKMDGKEATRVIRGLEEASGQRVPIVALTAHALEGDDKGILAAGLDHYLTKPLRKPRILEMVSAFRPPDAFDPQKAELAEAV